MPRFSGHTCDARRAVASLFLLGLLLPSLPLAAAATSTPPSQLSSAPILLGFGPSSMSLISNGVPVYTVGETVWMESDYVTTVSVSLVSPPPASEGFIPTNVSAQLSPQTVTALYTFTQLDTDGVWNLTVQTNFTSITIPIHMVNLAAHPVSLGPLSYSLSGGNLSISSQASLGNSYDQQVCTVGPIANAGVTLPLPKDMHESGTITLNPAIPQVSPVALTVNGHVNETFSFWFELYHPYSLESLGTDSLILENLETASSVPITFLSAVSIPTTLSFNMPERSGRYELRSFFENATTLQVFQTNLLIVNGSTWISLSNDCNPEAVQSQSVTYSANLNTGLTTWPDQIYLMYRTLGVEGVTSYPVQDEVSSVSFFASPSGTFLKNFTVSVPPTSGVQVSQSGGTMYVLDSSYPVNLDYALSFDGGRDIAQGTVTIDGRTTAQATGVSLATLSVHVLSQDPSPATVQVTGANGVNTSTHLSPNETASLFLPTGTYAVSATQGDNTEAAQVTLTDGLSSSITLNFNTYLSLEIILVATAIMAGAANVAFWIFRSRTVRARLAKSQ